MASPLETLLQGWNERLAGWAADGPLATAARHALNLDADPPLLQELVAQWASRDFSALPPIVLLPATSMPGAAGAYAISTGTIYLNQDWLQTATEERVQAVLTEELGHHLDALLNSRDTPGDEGELFAARLLGGVTSAQELLRLPSENDALTLLINGAAVAAEASAPDTLAPVIQGFSLGSTSLDPSLPGGAYLSTSLQFSDNLSGFDYGYLSFRSTSSSQSRSLYLSSSSLQGSRLAGTVFASEKLDPFTAAGTWELSSIELRDSAGNSLYKSSGSSDWNTFLSANSITQTSFQVVYGNNPAPGTGPDSLAPVIQGFSLGSTSLDPSLPGGAYLSTSLQFSDNLSGFDYGYLSFRST
ncbi:hypothetical protein KBY88_11755, partial [Cyanobium sp. Morenito 9A2]|nr:hypothetical protein [Cyanobium sp. Morenito 9A2]